MLLRIPGVLDPEHVSLVRKRLDDAGEAWADGRVTAGHQGARVKHNLQLAEDSTIARELGATITAALECNPLFLSAALPSRVYPPMFNRYDGAHGMQFGTHVDGAVRLLPGTGTKIRTDISATLFISAPEEYDGGELLVEDTHGTHSAKLPAGDLVLYPATSLHRVTPVIRGARIASFFWVQSLVRDDAQRALLFDLDMAIVRLTQTAPDHESLVSLTGCYHNLLRMWAEP
ncbi:MAG TPA: Fe2+-dependent dioxygenase [Burkholderiales bacterium]|nr:Fe2+-dependent dioxygenase [Burkholderiales bacterium]